MTSPAPDDRDARLAGALADFIDLESRGERVSIDSFCRRLSCRNTLPDGRGTDRSIRSAWRTTAFWT